MEEGTHVWLRTAKSDWGWIPAKITKKDVVPIELGSSMDEDENAHQVIQLTLVDDYATLAAGNSQYLKQTTSTSSGYGRQVSGMMDGQRQHHEPFSTTITMEMGMYEHPDVKLRNMPASSSSAALFGGIVNSSSLHDPKGKSGDPPTLIHDDITGGVDDLIGLTHLHEPAILHALRLRYTADIIYTSTGPILLAINPFKEMEGVYAKDLMELYRRRGEEKLSLRVNTATGSSSGGSGSSSNPASPTGAKSPSNAVKSPTSLHIAEDNLTITPMTDNGKPISPLYLHRPNGKLPPHVYQTADDAYRAMMRGIDMDKFLKRGRKSASNHRNSNNKSLKEKEFEMPTNQSILVSGESGAGKTVTTKIVLNYFAMLSRKLQEQVDVTATQQQQKTGNSAAAVSIEQQILQSNPILEAFGNARTMRNDNSSRFGKYINIAFTSEGKLQRASIDTYLLEKVRLIHQSSGERNFHIFYQFLGSASNDERAGLSLGDLTAEDFMLTNCSETYERRDGVDDVDMHSEMVEAMRVMNFGDDTVQQLMRLVVAILFAGNMKFVSEDGNSSFSESCLLEEDEASTTVAKLLGVSFDKLAAALTTKVLFARGDIIHKGLGVDQARKANEALIKSIYGAAFDFITEKINASINAGNGNNGGVSESGSGSKRQSLKGGSTSSVGASIVPPGGASIGVLGECAMVF